VTTLAIILVIQTFFVQPFRIPTESMEDTLLVGDFLFVSKLHYGPRTPQTLGLPFTPLYIPGVTLPNTRLPGFSDVRRNDVAVFNYPPSREFDVIIPERIPIDRRTPYIKRIVGMPGDTLSVVDKEVFIGGRRQAQPTHVRFERSVFPAGQAGLPPARLADARADYRGMVPGPDGQPADPRQYVVVAGEEGAAQLEALSYIERVQPFVRPPHMTEQGIWPVGAPVNRDNYGPLVIPAQGMTILMNPEAWAVYGDAIVRYEGRAASLTDDGAILIDGAPVTAYTFTQDYFFAMGDNRDSSLDSRFWGFVPRTHMVGKAFLVFFSFDMRNRILGIIPTPRIGRFFKPIR